MGWGGRVPKARKGRNTGGRPQIFTILIIVSAWDPRGERTRGTSRDFLLFDLARRFSSPADFHFAWRITCRIIIKIYERRYRWNRARRFRDRKCTKSQKGMRGMRGNQDCIIMNMPYFTTCDFWWLIECCSDREKMKGKIVETKIR